MPNDMNKARIVIVIGIIAIIAVAMFGGSWFFFKKDESVPVSWEIMKMMLHEGEVSTIIRSEEGIYFILKNDKTISSEEPYGNALEGEIQKCGTKCSGIEYIRQ